MASNIIILVEEDDVASTSGPRPTSSTVSYSDLTYIGQATNYIPPSGVRVAQAPFDTPISNQPSDDQGEHGIVALQEPPASREGGAVGVVWQPRKPQKPVSEKDIEKRRKNTISARKSRYAKNQREMNILDSAIGLTDKNKELMSKLETAEKRLATAENRVATAENRLATAETKIGELLQRLAYYEGQERK